jgi:uncharacterized protein (TIGR02145 family)
MKISRITLLIVMLITIVINSCSDDNSPGGSSNNNNNGGGSSSITISTAQATNITNTTAVSGGNIISDGGSAIIDRGVCWSTNVNPTISDFHVSNGNGLGVFISNLIGLSAGTMYYVRAYATNSISTEYGNEISITTTVSGGGNGCSVGPTTVTDFDGNVYNVVSIGSQCWMKENLKTTHYRNGTGIVNFSSSNQWSNATFGSYTEYNSSSGYGQIYGKLYNFLAVANPAGLCPTGWHVPTDAEWTTLENSLGGSSIAGGKMKEIGTTYWSSPNAGASNSSGFSGLPGGYRDDFGQYVGEGYNGYWWSSTQIPSCYFRYLNWLAPNVNRSGNNELFGYSVRCVRD